MLPRFIAFSLYISYCAVDEDHIIKCINKLNAKQKAFPTVCIDENKISLRWSIAFYANTASFIAK